MGLINNIFKKRYKIAVGIFLLLLLLQLQSIISTFFMGKMLDKVIENNYEMAIKLVLVSGAYILIINSLNYVYSILIKKYDSEISYEIKNKVYSILENVRWIKLKEFSPNYLVDRVNKDVSVCSNFFLDIKPSLYVNIANVLVISIFFIFINPISLIVILILIALNFSIYIFSYKKIYNKQREEVEKRNKQINIEINWFNKINLVKRENIVDLMLEDIEKGFKGLLKKVINLAKVNSKYSLIGGIISIFSTVALMLFLLYQVIYKRLTVGEFIIAFSYYGELSKHITSILNYGKDLQNYKVSVDRIEELINLEPAINGALNLNKIDKISLKNISINFGEENLINNFSYEFKKGNVYLIQGKNGVGKSTLIDSILGVLDNYSGEIYINSNNQKQVNMRLLREIKIAFASQEPILLDGDLNKNINLEFKNRKSNLFNLEYLEDKSLLDNSLSGGEKRKIVISRALAKEADVLIFDEPDTFLDCDSLNKFRNYLENKFLDKIVIIISHNKDFIELSDRIINL